MIKSITVTNPVGEAITLELGFPEKSGFLILGIDGLGPSKAVLNTTDMATSDGARFTSSKIISRNIILRLKLLSKPTIEATRLLSYKYFPVKKRVTILIETDTRLCETYGYIESNDPDIFSPSEVTTVSILCTDPYFYAQAKDLTIFSGVFSLLEFPLENDSITEDMIQVGNVDLEPVRNILYLGDVDVGVTIRIRAYGPSSGITLQNQLTNEVMYFDVAKIEEMTGVPFSDGDELIVSTAKGNKFIYLLREGVFSSAMNCLDKDSDWISLTKGDNVFAYAAETGILNIAFQVENQIAYEGV